jgi:EF hand
MSMSRRPVLALASFVIAVLAALAPTEAEAKCCNIITTQSCADCNFFMCHCKNSCDCKNPCATNCSQDQNACIADCTQSNCSYCDGYYHACMDRCSSSAATSSPIADPAPDASAPTAACQQVYKAVDADRNGALSKKEFVDFIVAQRKVAWPTNGALTPVQAAVGSIAGKDPAAVFASLDTNHDGTIDRAEAGLP